MNLRRSAVAHLIAAQAIWVILAYFYPSVSAHDVDIEISLGSVPGSVGRLFSAPVFLISRANSAGEFTPPGWGGWIAESIMDLPTPRISDYRNFRQMYERN